jgi:hypothetical protein
MSKKRKSTKPRGKPASPEQMAKVRAARAAHQLRDAFFKAGWGILDDARLAKAVADGFRPTQVPDLVAQWRKAEEQKRKRKAEEAPPHEISRARAAHLGQVARHGDAGDGHEEHHDLRDAGDGHDDHDALAQEPLAQVEQERLETLDQAHQDAIDEDTERQRKAQQAIEEQHRQEEQARLDAAAARRVSSTPGPAGPVRPENKQGAYRKADYVKPDGVYKVVLPPGHVPGRKTV